jgi:hypothetical protein
MHLRDDSTVLPPTPSKLGLRLTLAAASFGLGLLANACVLPNPNHCHNLAIDPNVWCAARFEDQPYCSPCVADNFGCVAAEPSTADCPEYTPSEATETGDTGETEDTGETGETEDTGETETEDTGETETGTDTSD